MLDRKYDSALSEVMAQCANDLQKQDALGDQASDHIDVLRDRALAYIRRSSAFSKEGEAVKHQATKFVVDDLFRCGPIEELLWDPDVSEIMANGPDNVWVERHGRLEPTGVHFFDEEHVRRTIERIISSDGCRCDDQDPECTCTLHREGAPFDGSRVSIGTLDNGQHWVLNIRKRNNDIDLLGLRDVNDHDADAFCQNIANCPLAKIMTDYNRAIVSARMGIDGACIAKKREAQQRWYESLRNCQIDYLHSQ